MISQATTIRAPSALTALAPRPAVRARSRAAVVVRAHKVKFEHQGKTYDLEVEDGDNILDAAIDAGIEDLSYDCKLGVCMTCPAKMTAGTIDASGSMLSEDVSDAGYTLLCVACPESDVEIATVPEDELLDLQLSA